MNESTAAMDIHTILFVLEDFLEPPEFISLEDGPSACFVGRRPDEGGGFWSESGPGKNGSDDGDGVPEVVVGGDNGAVLELNGFPSPLHVKKKISKLMYQSSYTQA